MENVIGWPNRRPARVTADERDAAQTADQVTEDLLRMFGLPADEARELCSRPMDLGWMEAVEPPGRRVTN